VYRRLVFFSIGDLLPSENDDDVSTVSARYGMEIVRQQQVMKAAWLAWNTVTVGLFTGSEVLTEAFTTNTLNFATGGG
jgi:hypothetical protein